MRPYIQNGSGIMALEPREQVILYLDGERTEEERTAMVMAPALGIPLTSLYNITRAMEDDNIIHIAETIKTTDGHHKRHAMHIYRLTGDGERLARVIHHVRMVRF